MSFDLNIGKTCDHRVFRELNSLEPDQRTLRFSRSLSSTSTVSIYATDNLIPSTMYDIIDDPQQIDVNINKIVYFKNRWKSPSDYFESTYLTFSNYCNKCAGISFLDDISYDIRGKLSTLDNGNLLLQNVEKILGTRINSNPFHTFIGTGLISLIGSNVANISFLAGQIKNETNRALRNLIDLQTQYEQAGRNVTPGEMLQSIDNISVTQDPNDPTIINVDITLTSRAKKQFQFTQILKMRN